MRPLSASNIPPNGSKTEENKENIWGVKDRPTRSWHDRDLPETLPDDQSPKEFVGKIGPGSISKQQVTTQRESDEVGTFCSDDTVVVKFVDTAIVGKSEAEDACHHGLVDPTINMKEAMNAINSMFREPIESAPVGRRSRRSRPKEDNGLNNGFEVFIDENLDNNQKEKGSSILQHSRSKTCPSQQEPFKIFVDDEGGSKTCLSQQEPFKIFVDGKGSSKTCPSQLEPFKIFVDDEGSSEIGERNEKENLEQSDVQNLTEGSVSSASHGNAFVFPSPNDGASDGSDEDAGSSPQAKFREDTVVCRFVGSTILDEPEVENACHHGLVDPTINLKEAMDDINNMFGKPIDFVRTRRLKKQDKAAHTKRDFGGFSILPDDDLEQQEVQLKPNLPGTSRECDLFEPTVFTKEAMDDINKLFGMPLDF
jgi:hypothetical protein